MFWSCALSRGYYLRDYVGHCALMLAVICPATLAAPHASGSYDKSNYTNYANHKSNYKTSDYRSAGYAAESSDGRNNAARRVRGYSNKNKTSLTLTKELPKASKLSQRLQTQAAGSVLEPEAQLARVYIEISKGKLNEALRLTDELLVTFPNFKLAHLVRGDLLLAKGRAIYTVGAGTNLPEDGLKSLREEANLRLQGFRDKPTTGLIPKIALQLPADQKYALMVELKRSRVYVFENKEGKPQYVNDFYITHGKQGAHKQKEGDQKTPIGIYQITSTIPRQKLNDFYGPGALPLNYPNEWDKRNERTGHGIWLHGVPSTTYSRPPKDSDGCVVLANPDFDALSTLLQPQPANTPVMITDSIEWATEQEWQQERKSMLDAIEGWRKDWESNQLERYLHHYSKTFATESVTYPQFIERKKQTAGSIGQVKVALSNFALYRYPNAGEVMLTYFDQDYRTPGVTQFLRKKMYWQKEQGKWKIIYEGTT